MTTEEHVKAKLKKWVVPGVPADERFHFMPDKDKLPTGPVITTARLEETMDMCRPHERWMSIDLSTDTLRLVDVRRPDEEDDYVMSPVPDNFETVLNWVRMIDNLTQG